MPYDFFRFFFHFTSTQTLPSFDLPLEGVLDIFYT